jgi:hypothetical protein
VIEDNDLEGFLEPLLAEWNRLAPDNLRALHAAPIASCLDGRVGYVAEDRSVYGYEFVELEIRADPAFTMRLQLEGRFGDLSMSTHLPVVRVEGDVKACATWLRTGFPG